MLFSSAKCSKFGIFSLLLESTLHFPQSLAVYPTVVTIPTVTTVFYIVASSLQIGLL